MLSWFASHMPYMKETG